MPRNDPDPLYRILEEAIDTALALWEDPAFAAIWQGAERGVWTRDDLPDLLGVPRKILDDDARTRMAELAMSAAAEIRTGTAVFG
jgi:hypothetical protein